MCASHKEGDVTTCDKYIAVTLLCTTCKIVAYVLYVRLVPHTEEIIEEYQGGFRTFTMRQILEKLWEQNIDVHQLFTDFSSTM
jgi:hypothetical protein